MQELTDECTYRNSLDQLSKLLIEQVPDTERDIIIALSRKGPRMLEFMRKKVQNQNGNITKHVITEHALPFLFNRILNDEEKYNLYIVDDAVYYGSTLKGVIDEIDEYINLLNLRNRVEIKEVYVAIKDKDSLPFEKILVGTEYTRDGFGHYFVKNLMKDIRSLGKSLEIEFPIVNLQCDKELNIDEVYRIFQQIFKDEVCKISAEEGGIPSVSVVLSTPDEITFRKFRVYVNGNVLNIASLSPELFGTDIKKLNSISFGNNEEVQFAWSKAVAPLLTMHARLGKHSSNISRNIDRTGIVLLGFFSSCDTFCYYKPNIYNAFKKAGYILSCLKLDTDNIKYLTGTDYIVNAISTAWEEAMSKDLYYTAPFNLPINSIEHIIAETHSITVAEMEELLKANTIVALNSATLEEAMSAMLFNQTQMLDRFTRRLNGESNDRLRFGYTYSSIRNFLLDNSRNLKSSDITLAKMHRWMDIQIDNGSVVPQYLIDRTNGKWIRTFRPGENEDIRISHLGRIVALVIKNMLRLDTDKQIGKVLKVNLEGILTVVYHIHKNELIQEEPFLTFGFDKRHVLYMVTSNNKDSVVDFLIRTSVLNLEQDKLVSLNKRLENSEFNSHTTLDKKLEDKISNTVNSIVNKIADGKLQAQFIYSNTINSFLIDTIDKDNLECSINNVVKLILEKKQKIQNLIADNSDFNSIKKELTYIVDSYNNNVSSYELNESVFLNDSPTNLRELRVPLLKVRKLNLILKTLIYIFLFENDDIKTWLNSLSDFIIDNLGYRPISDKIREAIKKDKAIKQETILLDKITSYVMDI